VRIRPFIVAALVCGAAALPLVGAVPGAQGAVPGSFTFGAVGDFGASTSAGATLTAVSTAGTDFFFALGDLSYAETTPESSWCSFVKSKVGSTYPFELVAGNVGRRLGHVGDPDVRSAVEQLADGGCAQPGRSARHDEGGAVDPHEDGRSVADS